MARELRAIREPGQLAEGLGVSAPPAFRGCGPAGRDKHGAWGWLPALPVNPAVALGRAGASDRQDILVAGGSEQILLQRHNCLTPPRAEQKLDFEARLVDMY